MDTSILHSMTYGVFILGTMDEDKPTGCVVNTVTQVSSQPPIFAVSVNHDNFTNECIKKTGTFSVCILSESAVSGTIGTFGFHSGRDTDKFESVPYELTAHGLPVLKDQICGFLECKVRQSLELSTHTLFLAELFGAERRFEANPMTYAYYQDVIKGTAPKASPIYHREEVANMSQDTYKCTICGYIYDGSEGPFEALPEDWVCPLCGAPKSAFKKV